MFSSVLVVCVGNICRSPMGEALFRALCKKNGKEIIFGSAGVSALVGFAADDKAQALMFEKDIDISTHCAVQLTRDVSLGFDLILVMEKGHIRVVEQMLPESRGKVHLLGKWNQDEEIADPYKKNEAHFLASFSAIERGVKSWMEYL
ncbi:MAG: low molecular weight protein-tyrosine-phosphatase [Ghiorsea sp.]|nr:low molecular weight protein-tyrosine-phosphatase [Ghiorsea sp.]